MLNQELQQSVKKKNSVVGGVVYETNEAGLKKLDSFEVYNDVKTAFDIGAKNMAD